jgi:predicted ester cyclase
MIARTTQEAPMDHAATMRRAFDDVNEGNLDGFMAMLADDFVEHQDLGGPPPTKQGVRQFFETFMAAARVRMTGTNEGELMGMPASGKSIDFEAIDIIRFRDDGMAVEHWGAMDTMAMLQQLGAVPGGAPA